MSARSLLPLAALLLAACPARGADPQPAQSAPKFAFEVVLSDLEPTRYRDARKAELFWAGLSASISKDGFGAEAEVRAKDGRFRPYYDGDFWLQRGAAIVESPVGALRVGKVDGGLAPEDETFSGTLYSDNGVSRNPEWGASVAGEKRFGWDLLAWSLRYAGRNDHVAFEQQGRGAESDPGASLAGGDGRVSWLVNKGLVTIRPALGAAAISVDSPAAGGRFSRVDVSGDLRVTAGPAWISFLAMNRNGSTDAAVAAADGGVPRLGYDRSWSWLFSFGAEFPTVTYRYSYSEWNYRGVDANERIHQPSVVWTPKKWIAATIEYSARRLRTAASGASAFNAFRFGLALNF